MCIKHVNNNIVVGVANDHLFSIGYVELGGNSSIAFGCLVVGFGCFFLYSNLSLIDKLIIHYI